MPKFVEEYLNPKGRLQTDAGHEIPDPKPIAPPIGYNRQPSLAEQIRTMVRNEKLQADLDAAGYETFEEADDFDVGDDYDPRSPYEQQFEPTPIPELKRRALEAQSAEAKIPIPSKTNDQSADQADTGTEPAKPAKSKAKPPKPSDSDD